VRRRKAPKLPLPGAFRLVPCFAVQITPYLPDYGKGVFQYVGDEERKVEQEQQPHERSFIRELVSGVYRTGASPLPPRK
jgi:hypothetical protein